MDRMVNTKEPTVLSDNIFSKSIRRLHPLPPTC